MPHPESDIVTATPSSIPTAPKNAPANASGAAREVRLDFYYEQIKTVILSRQHPISGLLPASTAVNSHGNYTDAWVRDNVYSILAVWGLALAYRKVDVDRGRAFELEGCVVKLMRGLLFAMMRQADKVERFKQTQSPSDALHAKYSTSTRETVVGDGEWGHLQLDATSLFLLMLAQMTASGLNIILTIDEVNFVQNLVYYVGRAYQTPDYGIWERGNKINSGYPELNASSIGMAKAALEALNGLDLFGVRGSQSSVLHVLPDEIARARITLKSLLPRESPSKEVDAALLSIIGFPAFAVEDAEMVASTRERIVQRLQGRYGCKRFLRDGHQTVIEDASRLHYEAWELKQFEHIECEWPLFFTYLLLDALFRGDDAAVQEYSERLESVLVEQDGVQLLPELYIVPQESIEAERAKPGSQTRRPNENVPLVWAQSLYYLGRMLQDDLLLPGDIDPLCRHDRVGARREPVVQIALLAADEAVQHEMEDHGIAAATPHQLEPVQVRLPQELAGAYNQIGRNDKIGLTGRPVRRLRSLTTSKVFRIRGEVMVFLPSFFDEEQFYLNLDPLVLVAQIRGELAYIRRHWRQAGRPTMTLLITRTRWETGRDAWLELLGEMREGRCGEVPVRLGLVSQLISSAAKERIDYLHDFEFANAPVSDAESERYFLESSPTTNELLHPARELEIERSGDAGDLLRQLKTSRNLFEQTELLQALLPLVGADYDTGWGTDKPLTIAVLLDEIYAQAARGDAGNRPYWGIVRRVAALQEKSDFALADAVTDLLVRQKQIAVGKAYFEDALIARPHLPAEITDKIRRFVREDVRERVLTQEIIIALGLLIKSQPRLLDNLMTLRTGHFILLLTAELAEEFDLRQEEAYERLMNSSPSEIQRRLGNVLAGREQATDLLRRQESLEIAPGANLGRIVWEESAIEAPEVGWMRWRRRMGSLNRVPDGFYALIWQLLHHCDGLIIGDKLERRNRLDSHLILSEMTADEINFAVWIEHLLNKIEFPEYRQLNIEAMMALARIAAQTPALRIHDFITLDILIGHAVRQCWLDIHPDREGAYDEDKPAAWRFFYDSSPAVCARSIADALRFLSA